MSRRKHSNSRDEGTGEISAIPSACDRKINALKYEARLLDELFQAMQDELMMGRLSTTIYNQIRI